MIAYAVAITFVKVSICVALLRIVEQKSHRIILWITIAITVATNLVGIIASFVGCQPISSAWEPGPDSICLSNNGTQGEALFIYVQFAIYISADLVCVLLPFSIVWNLRMKRTLKLSTAGVLGLGAL